jgi:SAM-dependent methyltransferase
MPDDAIRTVTSWYDYAEALLPARIGSYLDYGCGRGEMLRRVSPRAVRACGVDVDPEVLRSIPGVETCVIREGDPLPFPNESFDVIKCLEVIEHVADERRTFRELARVLRPGGTLILTTPHKGWLTWMDPGNVKFALPRLHRFVHRCLGNRKYEAQFGDSRRQELGMISDISANQDHPWHRHYKCEEIGALVDDSLRMEHVETAYPGMRATWYVVIFWRALFRRNPKWMDVITRPLSRWKTVGGDQLVILFRKSDERNPA